MGSHESGRSRHAGRGPAASSGSGHGGGASAEAATAAILDSIRRIVRVLHVATGAAERSIGISAAQLFVLRKVAEAPASSLNEVAARTYTHQSSVSVVVQRLVERGLVTRARSARDGRRLDLSLTPAGRALLRRAPDAVQQRFVEALTRMPPRSRGQLATTLGRLVAEIGAATEPATMFFEDDASRGARGDGDGKGGAKINAKDKGKGNGTQPGGRRAQRAGGRAPGAGDRAAAARDGAGRGRPRGRQSRVSGGSGTR